MSFEEFQDGSCGSQIGYRNRMILAILYLCVTVMPPIKFWLNPTQFGRCRLKNFKMATMAANLDIGTILAILNLCVTVMPPIKFWLNLTYGLGEMSFEEFQDGRLGGHFGYRNRTSNSRAISNSESLCHCDASYQVLAQSNLWFWEEMLFAEFQDGHHGGHLGYLNGTILAILNLCALQ